MNILNGPTPPVCSFSDNFIVINPLVSEKYPLCFRRTGNVDAIESTATEGEQMRGDQHRIGRVATALVTD